MNAFKYRKMSPDACDALTKVPIQEVAKIAAILVREGGLSSDEKNPLVVATAKAFELLEIAYYGRQGLADNGSYEAGLAEFVEKKRIDEEFLAAVVLLLEWEPKYDEYGQPLPEPFDDALKMLIPLPGSSGEKAKDERMVRFKAWLSDFYSEQEPDPDKRLVLVGSMIEEMKQKGIPSGLLTKAILFYPSWWETRLREQKSAAGRKGQEVKQAQVGSREDARNAKSETPMRDSEEKNRRESRIAFDTFRRDFAFGHPRPRPDSASGTPAKRQILLESPFVSSRDPMCLVLCVNRDAHEKYC